MRVLKCQMHAKRETLTPTIIISWQSSLPSIFKLNFDGSLSGYIGLASAGGPIQDSNMYRSFHSWVPWVFVVQMMQKFVPFWWVWGWCYVKSFSSSRQEMGRRKVSYFWRLVNAAEEIHDVAWSFFATSRICPMKQFSGVWGWHYLYLESFSSLR